jgi:hypothetical protein
MVMIVPLVKSMPGFKPPGRSNEIAPGKIRMADSK